MRMQVYSQIWSYVTLLVLLSAHFFQATHAVALGDSLPRIIEETVVVGGAKPYRFRTPVSLPQGLRVYANSGVLQGTYYETCDVGNCYENQVLGEYQPFHVLARMSNVCEA